MSAADKSTKAAGGGTNSAAKTIQFFNPTDEYGIFSNYSVRWTWIGKQSYESMEHYYQSQKFVGVDEKYAEIIRTAKTPHQAKLLGGMKTADGPSWRLAINKTIMEHKSRGVRIRDNWESVKEKIMLKGLKAKFDQHATYGNLLLSTGDSTIVEASPHDWYWGCGDDGTGKNRLGVLLMEVRDWLREEDASEAANSACKERKAKREEQERRKTSSVSSASSVPHPTSIQPAASIAEKSYISIEFKALSSSGHDISNGMSVGLKCGAIIGHFGHGVIPSFSIGYAPGMVKFIVRKDMVENVNTYIKQKEPELWKTFVSNTTSVQPAAGPSSLPPCG
jgi:N-glycosidase YbiA